MKKLMALVMTMVMLVAFAVPAMAAENDFVPSVEVKPGPEIIVGTDDENGTPSYGTIVMPDGTKIPLPEGSITITPISKADSATEDIEEALKDAFEELSGAESLEDLIDQLKEILEEQFPGVDVDDLVITDLFHVDVSEDYEEYFEQGGKLELTISATDELILALNKKDSIWSLLFGSNFIDNGDGTYTLIIDGEGIFALLKNVLSIDVDPENPGQDSPTTGDMSYLYVIGGVLFTMMAGALLIVAKKQKA